MTAHSTMTARVASFLVGILLICPAAHAQFNSGSDGSDGAFEPTESVEIDLSLATTASWDTPSPVPGQGVYDPDKWAVVFKYSTIAIPGGVTVTFKNHASGAPVVWLASGDVSVTGIVNLNGKPGGGGLFSTFAEGGPGGFRGGQRGLNSTFHAPSAGFGPGGAPPQIVSGHSGGGGYASEGGIGQQGSPGGAPYGNARVLPLIGGSGGGGTFSTPSSDAGAGGGAILVASSGDIEILGEIQATGGLGYDHAGGGSGGAIRLIANRIHGGGRLFAFGSGNVYGSYGVGSPGRISVEAFEINLTDFGNPPWNWVTEPGPVFPPVEAPTLKATLVDNVPIPSDPMAGILTSDVYIENHSPVAVEIEATGIPADATDTVVQVRIVPERGPVIEVSEALADSDGDGIWTATVSIEFPVNRSEMQLRATWTPSP